jgi:hypothetical protein
MTYLIVTLMRNQNGGTNKQNMQKLKKVDNRSSPYKEQLQSFSRLQGSTFRCKKNYTNLKIRKLNPIIKKSQLRNKKEIMI